MLPNAKLLDPLHLSLRNSSIVPSNVLRRLYHKKLDYWNSASRFFEWDHLRSLKPLNGIWLVRSREELITAINVYLKDPSHLCEGRKKIVREECQYTDGESGARIAEKILSTLIHAGA